MPLILECDVPEGRVVSPQLVAGVDGLSWDTRYFTNTYLCPVTSALSLLPLPDSEFWGAAATGDYARFSAADYVIPTPAKWVQNQRLRNGDHWLESLGVNEQITTAASYPPNTAFFLAWHTHAVRTENQTVIECGYLGAGGPRLRFRASGRVEVWRNGELLETYDLQAPLALSGKKPRGRALALGGQVFSVKIIPEGRNRLTVIPSIGEGFSHSFDHLSPEAEGNAITPAGQFFWYVPPRPLVGGGSEYVKASVQCALLRRAAAGSAISLPIRLRIPPAAGRVFTPVTYGEILGSSSPDPAVTLELVRADTLAPFVPNGALRDVRVKAMLTGGGTGTPSLWAGFCVADPIVANTSDEAFDLKPYTKKISLSVPERGPATLTIDAMGPNDLEDAGLIGITEPQDFTVRLAVETELSGGGSATFELFRGTVDPEKTEIVWNKGRGDKATGIRFVAEDRDAELRHARALHSYPIDGFTISGAITQRMKEAGFAVGQLDITPDLYTLPILPSVARGEWRFLPQIGEPASESVGAIMRDHAATWVEGWTPTAAGVAGYKRRFRRPDTLPTAPAMYIYLSRADAEAAGVPGQWGHRRVIRGQKSSHRPKEVNHLIVVGQDRYTGKTIIEERTDPPSMVPTTERADRPSGWRSRRHFGLYEDSTLTTPGLVLGATNAIWPRVSEEAVIEELKTELLILAASGRPLWKGDIVRVFEPSDTPGEAPVQFRDYRIEYFNTSFDFEGRGDAASLRESMYTIKAVGPFTIEGSFPLAASSAPGLGNWSFPEGVGLVPPGGDPAPGAIPADPYFAAIEGFNGDPIPAPWDTSITEMGGSSPLDPGLE